MCHADGSFLVRQSDEFGWRGSAPGHSSHLRNRAAGPATLRIRPPAPPRATTLGVISDPSAPTAAVGRIDVVRASLMVPPSCPDFASETPASGAPRTETKVDPRPGPAPWDQALDCGRPALFARHVRAHAEYRTGRLSETVVEDRRRTWIGLWQRC
ncbi:hypothetical protein GCM10027089_59430 [Nocardia thraciensis]